MLLGTFLYKNKFYSKTFVLKFAKYIIIYYN